MASSSAGALSNPEFFSYGVEVYEAYKKRSLTSDIIDEQKKVQEADLVIFQVCFPLIIINELDSFYVQTLSKYLISCSRSGLMLLADLRTHSCL